MLKKVLVFITMSFLVFCFMSTVVNAIELPVGDIRLTIIDWTFFDDPIPVGSNNPGASGNLWGIFRVDTIADANGNIVWTTGQGGEYLHGVIGNMTLHYIGVGGTDTQPGTPNYYPYSTTGYHVSLPGLGYVDDDWIDAGNIHNAYFVSAGLPAYPMYLQTAQPYLFVFISNEDDFIGSLTDGFETGPNIAGLGAFGTFGGDIITGTPFLFGSLNATALVTDEPFTFTADGVDVFRASTVSSTTAQTRFYLDVDPSVGVGYQFDTNTQLSGTDIRVDVTNEFRDPTTHTGWNSESQGQAFANIVPPRPCIDIEKEISIDNGITWLDADTVDAAAKATVPSGAKYRLIVTNCGLVDLFNVTINDTVLGITNYFVGNLPAGASVTLTSGEIPQLNQPQRCMTAGSYDNTACVTGSANGTTVSDCDPAWLVCETALACRVTAGGVKDGITAPCTLKSNGMPDSKTCAETGPDTWGGQAGAQPGIDGNWTHHHKPSSSQSFVFHSNNLFEIKCSDPGCCVPACANADNRQIDFKGYGRFTNQKGYSFPEETLCFTVHLEDIGEPGPGGRWPSATEPCTHCPGTPIQPADCKNCTDYYEIRIYGNAECTGSPIYVNGMPPDPTLCPGSPFVGYFTRSGNVQMHPENN